MTILNKIIRCISKSRYLSYLHECTDSRTNLAIPTYVRFLCVLPTCLYMSLECRTGICEYRRLKFTVLIAQQNKFYSIVTQKLLCVNFYSNRNFLHSALNSSRNSTKQVNARFKLVILTDLIYFLWTYRHLNWLIQRNEHQERLTESSNNDFSWRKWNKIK